MDDNCQCYDISHPTQYSGIPGCSVVTPTIVEELQYKISRASKRPLIHLDYNATACYDRIVLLLGSLASRSFGQHRNITLINARTLQDAKYYLKTQLGISETFYKHCQLHPIYGSGQGAGNSPAIWCCISSILFNVYNTKAHGALFTSPDQSYTVQVFMIGFVDDTSSSTNNFLLPNLALLPHYIQLATNNAQCWNDVPRLSGGALEETKCSYHVLYYHFTNTGIPVPAGGIFELAISIQYNDTTPTCLQQLPASTAHKTLGIRKSPSGTTAAEYRALQVQNRIHAQVISRSPFTHLDTWTYYHAIYIPNITYSFPTNNLSLAHTNALQTEIKKVILPKLGFNCSTPNAIVYGHSDYARLNFRHLSTERYISQILQLITTLRTHGVPHQLAMIALNWAQLVAGVSFNILACPTIPLPHIAPMSWIPSIRTGLATLHCSLEVSNITVIPLQRENDTHDTSFLRRSARRPGTLSLLPSLTMANRHAYRSPAFLTFLVHQFFSRRHHHIKSPPMVSQQDCHAPNLH